MCITGSGEQIASCISSLNTPAHSDHSGVSGLERADRQTASIQTRLDGICHRASHWGEYAPQTFSLSAISHPETLQERRAECNPRCAAGSQSVGSATATECSVFFKGETTGHNPLYKHCSKALEEKPQNAVHFCVCALCQSACQSASVQGSRKCVMACH